MVIGGKVGMRLGIPLEEYVELNKESQPFSSTEELLQTIQGILLCWIDQEKKGESKREKLLSYWESRAEATKERLPYLEVERRFSLQGFTRFLLWLSIAVELFSGFLEELQERGLCADHGLTLENAFLLYSGACQEDRRQVYALTDPENRINILLFEEGNTAQTTRLLERTVRVKKTVLDFVLGECRSVSTLEGVTNYEKGDCGRLLHDEERYEQCRRFLNTKVGNQADTGKSRLVYLFGESGNGKHFFVRKLSEEKGLVSVNVGFLLERRQVKRDFEYITSFCALQDCYVSLEKIPEEMDQDILEYLVARLSRFLPVVFVVMIKHRRMAEIPNGLSLQLMFSGACREEQKQIWEYFAGQFQCPLFVGHGEELANRYRLTVGEIREILKDLTVRQMTEDAREGLEQGKEVILSRLVDKASMKLQGLAVPLVTNFSKEDLQLPRAQGRILEFTIEAIKNRYLIMEKMKLSTKMPYGQAISILLYGPPGTGKTMTAQVIAKEVGLSLFRVDASKIVDKYIGETEKKLGELFDTAKNTNAILFFDEADSLFAKRTEVSKSTDKYANNEVSFLLQQMEQYDGIMVLATNHSNYFDEAFRRRITYSINLPAPDEETRHRLWLKAFPEGVEIDRDVDFALLAKEHEFTGSSIKYVVQQALYTAAILNCKVNMECIHTGLKLMEERDCLGYKDSRLQGCYTSLLQSD